MNYKVGIELVSARNRYMGKREINEDSSVQLEGKILCLLSPLVDSWRSIPHPLSYLFSAHPPFSCSVSKKHLNWFCNRRVKKCSIRPLEFNLVHYGGCLGTGGGGSGCVED